jgi:hypothetical protein
LFRSLRGSRMIVRPVFVNTVLVGYMFFPFRVGRWLLRTVYVVVCCCSCFITLRMIDH